MLSRATMEAFRPYFGTARKDGFTQVHIFSSQTSLRRIDTHQVALGSYDSNVFVWDIGGRKGTVYEMSGHRNKVNAVHYYPGSRSLMSTGEDSNLVIWNMNVRRDEVK